MDKKGVEIVKLEKEMYDKIPSVYAASFDEPPWEENWYDIPQFNKDAVWVAQYTDDIVGYIITFISKGRPYISVLATIPTFRRCGVATKLVETVIDYWKNGGYHEIIVHTDNYRKSALSFYKKAGFTTCSKKDDYVGLKRRI